MSDTPHSEDERIVAITEGILGSLRDSGNELRSSAFSHTAPWVQKATCSTPSAERPTPITDVEECRDLWRKLRQHERINDLERQLAEANERLAQVHRDLGHELRDPNGTIWDECARLQRELAEAREQRDALLEALEKIASGAHNWKTCVDKIAPEAIAAAKGGAQ